MIPRTFQVMSMSVTVEVTPLKKDKCGDWDFKRQKIRIAPLSEKMLPDGQLQTFWHEALHATLDVLGYKKLSSNEKFVDRVAQCLAQIEQTRK